MKCGETMKISEITGSKLKRDLGGKRALKSYHNKHRDGSGNFGFVVVFDDPGGLAGERWFRIDGEYSSTGEVTRLSAGPYAEAGHAVFPISYQQLIHVLKETGGTDSAMGERKASGSEVAGPRVEKTDLTIEKLKEELRGFTGAVNYYRHFTGLKYTDGVKYLADRAEAHWLLDAVFSYQTERRIRELPFQIWTLKVIRSELGKSKKEPMAVLEMREDTNEPVLVRQKIEYTSFPVGEIKLYLIDGVLMLPSEY